MAVPEGVRYIIGAIDDAVADGRGKGAVMDWARILAYVTGTVDQEPLGAERISGRRNPHREGQVARAIETLGPLRRP
jgi:hypothetical protein